tara:strand:+ start:79 stop:228 length:150 start_codon:yes stop_codon:yes gene_type:complete
MAISRAQMGKQVKNGPVTKGNRTILTLPKGVKRNPRMMTRLMRESGRCV